MTARRRGLLVLAIVVVAVVSAIEWPAEAVDFADRLAPPSPAHPFGTDVLGRDVLARVLGGVQYSVGLGLLAVTASAVVGTATGILTGWLDAGRAGGAARAVQSVVDLLASLPALLVGLLVAAVLGPGLGSALTAVVVMGWAPVARQAHRLTVTVRVEGWVTAARALGAGPGRLLVAHVLPAIADRLTAALVGRFAGAVLTLAGLSFLGLGVQPPTPEWGAMLAEGRTSVFVAPWLVVAPAGALVLTTLLLGALTSSGEGAEPGRPRRATGVTRRRRRRPADFGREMD